MRPERAVLGPEAARSLRMTGRLARGLTILARLAMPQPWTVLCWYGWVLQGLDDSREGKAKVQYNGAE